MAQTKIYDMLQNVFFALNSKYLALNMIWDMVQWNHLMCDMSVVFEFDFFTQA